MRPQNNDVQARAMRVELQGQRLGFCKRKNRRQICMRHLHLKVRAGTLPGEKGVVHPELGRAGNVFGRVQGRLERSTHCENGAGLEE